MQDKAPGYDKWSTRFLYEQRQFCGDASLPSNSHRPNALQRLICTRYVAVVATSAEVGVRVAVALDRLKNGYAINEYS